MTDQITTIAQALIDKALANGADAADAVVSSGTAVSIDVRGGRLEQAERAEGIDLGLRVLVGQRQAIVSASDTKDATLDGMALRAVAMAREAPEDPHIGLASPEQLATDWDADALELADPAPEPSSQTLTDQALEAEAAAMAVDGVTQMDGTSASYTQTELCLAASNGFTGAYKRTGQSLTAIAIAGEGAGMERDYDGDMRIFGSDLRDPGDIGRLAGQRAVERLGARKPATGTFPVLFDERISSSLIGHLMAAINGSAISRGSSWLLDGIGTRVLPETLSLVEDPHRVRVTGSRPFDAEGLDTPRRDIVADGVLTGWVLDLATARKLGLSSTGNAGRGVSAPPHPVSGNLTLTPGEQTRDALIRDMGTGLLVTSMIGSTINPTTGDYSRGASGFWVENGEIAFPVNECTIAGNLRDMLARLVPANDARAHLSRVVPSLLIDGLTLAGE